MNKDWYQFLQQQGATFDKDNFCVFSTPSEETAAAANSTVMADLSHLGLIRVSGEDAMDFLQNQFSNDIKQVNESQSQLNAYCNPKGRMLASFRIFQIAKDYYLVLSADILEQTLKRLRMFVLRSKVTLDNVSDDWVAMGIAGEKAVQLLEPQFSHLPHENHQSVHEKNKVIIRVPGPIPRFELHGPADSLIPLWTEACTLATPIGKAGWDWLDIQAGLPLIQQQTVEAFVPQMVNFSTIGGVSFTKGCYPGQEVVARMHYLGKLKRRMYLGHVDSGTVPQPGDELFPHQGDGSSCGKIVQAQAAPNGGVDFLAVLQIASAEKDTICLGGPDGAPIRLEDDPYPVTNEA